MKKILLIILLLFLTSCTTEKIEPNITEKEIISRSFELGDYTPKKYDFILTISIVFNEDDKEVISYKYSIYTDSSEVVNIAISCNEPEHYDRINNNSLSPETVHYGEVPADFCTGDVTFEGSHATEDGKTLLTTIDFAKTFDDYR